MSRHDLRPKLNVGIVTRGSVGWDRALQTFFAQLFSINQDGEEEPHFWVGTFPRELATAAAAIAVVEADWLVPEGLAATLETERLASLSTFDGPQQADLKSRFLHRPPSEADD
jgi:hypothetical protein